MAEFRFACLGSGSGGNALLVEAGGTRILVDAGFAVRELERRLAQIGVDPRDLDAILVTHEHGDHVRGAPGLARRHRIPLWMTQGTRVAAGCDEVAEFRPVNCHGQPFSVGAIQVEPFPIRHDAREPCHYLLRHGGLTLGLFTDAGEPTRHSLDLLRACDALVLECNHDPHLLATGPYPPPLRRRVGGTFGHLSNQQAAALLREMDIPRIQHLVAAHLSAKNNRPELAVHALLEVEPALKERLSVADQGRPGPWLTLNS